MSTSLTHRREQTIEQGIAKGQRLLSLGEQASTRYTRWRVIIFFIAVFACLVLYKAAWFHTGNLTLAVFIFVFFFVTHAHNALKHRLHRLRIWSDIKRTNLARLRLDWKDIPSHAFPSPDHHAFAQDLDITGPHSLLSLLDVTLSLEGQHRLAHWILDQNAQPVGQSEWNNRQTLAKEITQLPLLRDRIRLEAQLISDEPLNGDRIKKLLNHPITIPQLPLRLVASIGLCLLTLLLGALTVTTGLPGYWTLSFGLYVVLYFYTARYLEPTFGRVQSLHHELEKLVAVVQQLERRHFTHQPQLHRICEPVTSEPDRPTHVIKQLAGICSGLSVKAHPLVHIILNALIPWDISFAHRLGKVCKKLASKLPRWIDRLATLDAVSSLGNFAYLNPEYVWPTLEHTSSAGMETGLTTDTVGHPLIAAQRRVRNSFDFRGLGQVLLVTGSNMSGKSTFLRTVGINVCLAQAGAPVCAQRFSWTWLRLFCCIRVTDSLAEGLSYFYAEVKRLRVVLDAVNEAEGQPVLFLIDEIYKGTNNRERLGGSQAFIQALQTGNGLGLLSTHDLELAQLERDGSRVTNMHFQETVGDGTLHFDYLLRQGPCPTTNALRIMAQEGLPVPDSEQRE